VSPAECIRQNAKQNRSRERPNNYNANSLRLTDARYQSYLVKVASGLTGTCRILPFRFGGQPMWPCVSSASTISDTIPRPPSSHRLPWPVKPRAYVSITIDRRWKSLRLGFSATRRSSNSLQPLVSTKRASSVVMGTSHANTTCPSSSTVAVAKSSAKYTGGATYMACIVDPGNRMPLGPRTWPLTYASCAAVASLPI
jgi:hypothetical protein